MSDFLFGYIEKFSFYCYNIGMRIVSGKYKSRDIKCPKTNAVRPTLDRVRESIFGIIQYEITDAKVLDLFAGSGAMGIEALSRGADEVIFVDKNYKCLSTVKENLEKFNEDSKCLLMDYSLALKQLDKVKFDVIFIDPPYATDFGERAIEFIDENKMLASNGILVWEKEVTKSYDITLKNLCIDRIKKYGSTQVVIIRNIEDIILK